MPRNRVITLRTIKGWSGGENTLKKPNIELKKLRAARVNAGMITSIDSVDIPDEALQYAKNAKVLFDKTERREGLSLYGPVKPNSNAVLKMAYLKTPDGDSRTYRFTPSTIHKLDGVWSAVTETVALAGTNSDRFNIATVFDVFVFTNNGANNVQWIDPGADQSNDMFDDDDLPDDLPHTKFRYCASFYNRVVMAALREENEILLAWSGEYGSKNTARRGLENLNVDMNETSGYGPLVDSPNDTSDFIKGLFSFTSVMIILRERSIWLANKQASFTNPFNCYSAVPGIGCDTSFSARITKYGLAWFDRRSKSIWHYVPGSTPENLGHPIGKSIICNISDHDLIFSTYNHSEDVYSLCIPGTGNIVMVWSYYFQEKAWTYNEYVGITSYDELEILTGYTTIDELVGIINDLPGTIDSLSETAVLESKGIFGFSTGELAISDPNVDTDLGVSFSTDLSSKTFLMPGEDIYVANIVIEVVMKISGVLELWYASDGGATPSSYQLGDSFQIVVLNKPQMITLRKVVHSRRYSFSLRANTGRFEVLSFEVWVTGAGDVNMTRQIS